MNKLREDVIKLVLTRFPPKWFNVSQYPNTYICKDLAPSIETLLLYKNNNNWEEYKENFLKEMENNKTLEKLLKSLQNDKNYALICYEKDFLHCHRSLIAELLVSQGVKWQEFA